VNDLKHPEAGISEKIENFSGRDFAKTGNVALAVVAFWPERFPNAAQSADE
jgi:hypothetical protein